MMNNNRKSGQIQVKPIAAKLTRDTDTFGRMDPYCIVTCGAQQQKTSVHNSGGKFPSWNDTLSFRVFSEDYISINLLDKDTLTADDPIADALIPLQKVLQTGIDEDWYPVN